MFVERRYDLYGNEFSRTMRTLTRCAHVFLLIDINSRRIFSKILWFQKRVDKIVSDRWRYRKESLSYLNDIFFFVWWPEHLRPNKKKKKPAFWDSLNSMINLRQLMEIKVVNILFLRSLYPHPEVILQKWSYLFIWLFARNETHERTEVLMYTNLHFFFFLPVSINPWPSRLTGDWRLVRHKEVKQPEYAYTAWYWINFGTIKSRVSGKYF